jgi:ATP-dependent DNA ligase
MGRDVYAKSGAEYTSKLPGMRKSFVELQTTSAILDCELCLIDPPAGIRSSSVRQARADGSPERRLP